MSIGQQRLRAASANTRVARMAGRGGSQASAPMGVASEGGTRAPSREQKERGRGPELGQGEQEPRRDRQRGGGGDPERLLQHQDEQPFPHAQAAGREQG